MGFLIEKRAEEHEIKSVISQILADGNLNEVKVNKNNIFSISSVSSAIDLIASTISSLDFKLYKKIDKTRIEEIEDDNRLYLLNVEPNFLMNSTQMKKAMIIDMITTGNAYVNIEKSKAAVTKLNYVESDNISVLLDTEVIHKDAKIMLQGEEYEVFQFIIATLDSANGVEGKGILDKNRDLLALALLVQSYLNKGFKSGGGRKGIWKSEKKLEEKAFSQFKQDAKDIQETDTPIVLNNTVNYTPLTNSNKDMQLLEIKQELQEEIRNIFNIPSKLDEQGFKTFVKVVLNPLINALEAAINKSLLLEEEKRAGLYFKVDVSELTRADIDTRFTAYKTSLDCGIESINEIRKKENLEPVEGLDLFKMTIGQALYNSGDNSWFVPNTGVKIDKEGVVTVNGENKNNVATKGSENTEESTENN